MIGPSISTEFDAVASSGTDRFISSEWLFRRLVRVAQVRSVVSLLSVFPMMAIGNSLIEGIGAVLGFFGGTLLVNLLMTYGYCHRAVRCPYCLASLWHCGTGNFKPRRMLLRADVQAACRQCGAVVR